MVVRGSLETKQHRQPKPHRVHTTQDQPQPMPCTPQKDMTQHAQHKRHAIRSCFSLSGISNSPQPRRIRVPMSNNLALPSATRNTWTPCALVQLMKGGKKSCRCTHQVRPCHQLGGELERRDDAVQSLPRIDPFHGLPANDLQKLRWKEPSTGKGGGRHATKPHRNTCTRSGSWPLVYEIEH